MYRLVTNSLHLVDVNHIYFFRNASDFIKYICILCKIPLISLKPITLSDDHPVTKSKTLMNSKMNSDHCLDSPLKKRGNGNYPRDSHALILLMHEYCLNHLCDRWIIYHFDSLNI